MSISIGFLILINKYLFESKLFHFLCSRIFVGKKIWYFITPNCEDPNGIMHFLRHCGLQDECNIGLLMVNIEFIWRGWETGERRALDQYYIWIWRYWQYYIWLQQYLYSHHHIHRYRKTLEYMYNIYNIYNIYNLYNYRVSFNQI
jgi:hypothetical protein